MSNHDDFMAGRYGGPRSDSPSFRWGETLRGVEEANRIVRDLMALPSSTSVPAAPNHLNQPRTFEPRVFDAWDARPRLSLVTFIVAVAVCLAFIWPALDAVGALPAPFLRIVLFGAACLFLSSWTKALPFISGGGALLLLAYGMMAG